MQRPKFGGTFAAEFQSTAWKVEKNSVVRLTFPPRGFVNKLFRVAEMEHRVDGTVPMVLREENASIYGAPSLSAPVDPVAASNYSPSNDPIITGIGSAAASLDGVAPVTLYADYLGVFLTDQLPFNFNVVRRRAGVDVSSSTTWSIVSYVGISGGAVTIDSNGYVTIPSGISMGSGAAIVVRSVRDGVTLETTVSVTKLSGQAPVLGGAGTTTVSDATLNAVSTTSFVDISDTMTVRTGSSGQIQFSAPLTVTTTKESPELEGAEGEVEIKWQYRTIGGSFADVASAVASSPDVLITYVPEFDKYARTNGSVTASPLLTGLSTSTDYEVKLVARRTASSPAKAISFIDTASTVGS